VLGESRSLWVKKNFPSRHRPGCVPAFLFSCFFFFSLRSRRLRWCVLDFAWTMVVRPAPSTGIPTYLGFRDSSSALLFFFSGTVLNFSSSSTLDQAPSPFLAKELRRLSFAYQDGSERALTSSFLVGRVFLARYRPSGRETGPFECLRMLTGVPTERLFFPTRSRLVGLREFGRGLLLSRSAHVTPFPPLRRPSGAPDVPLRSTYRGTRTRALLQNSWPSRRLVIDLDLGWRCEISFFFSFHSADSSPFFFPEKTPRLSSRRLRFCVTPTCGFVAPSKSRCISDVSILILTISEGYLRVVPPSGL